MKRRKKYFDNYLFYARKIKRIARKMLGECIVFVFGSIVKNQITPESDIDILIISPKIKNSNKADILSRILKEIGYDNPFEIHFITPEEYQNWYRNFVKQDKIEVE